MFMVNRDDIYRIKQFSYKKEFMSLNSFFKKNTIGLLGIAIALFLSALGIAINFIFKFFNSPGIIIVYLLIGVIILFFIYFFVINPFKYWLKRIIGIQKSYPGIFKMIKLENAENSMFIPRLKLLENFSMVFKNKVRIFKMASFKVLNLKGETWRIGMKLIGINGTTEIFIFHSYINNSNQHGLSYLILDREKENEAKTEDSNYEINFNKPFKYSLVNENGKLRCFLNKIEVGTDKEFKIDDKDNLHLVKFHFWNHGIDSIEADLSEIEVIWE